MCKMTTALEKRNGDQLEEVYKEAGGFAVADSIHEIWQIDKQRNEFYADQIKNSMYIANQLGIMTNMFCCRA